MPASEEQKLQIEDAAVRAGAVPPDSPDDADDGAAGAPGPGTGRAERTGGAGGPGKGAFRALGERERFAGGFLRLVTGTFVGPDGFIFDRDIVRHPGAVVIAAVEEDGRHVLCIRQFRAAVNDVLLELPAGKLDVAEEPIADCAARELAEEVGVEAATLTQLCSYYNSPGFADERSTLFLAEGLTPCERSAQGVEEHNIEIERVDLRTLDEMIATGRIVNGNTILGLLMAREELRRRRRGVRAG